MAHAVTQGAPAPPPSRAHTPDTDAACASVWLWPRELAEYHAVLLMKWWCAAQLACKPRGTIDVVGALRCAAGRPAGVLATPRLYTP